MYFLEPLLKAVCLEDLHRATDNESRCKQEQIHLIFTDTRLKPLSRAVEWHNDQWLRCSGTMWDSSRLWLYQSAPRMHLCNRFREFVYVRANNSTIIWLQQLSGHLNCHMKTFIRLWEFKWGQTDLSYHTQVSAHSVFVGAWNCGSQLSFGFCLLL